MTPTPDTTGKSEASDPDYTSETEDLLDWIKPIGPDWREMACNEILQVGDVGLVRDKKNLGFYLAYADGWAGYCPGSSIGPDKAWTRRPAIAKDCP